MAGVADEALITERHRTFALGNSSITVKVHGEETGGAYSVLEYLAAPGAGNGPHVHYNEDETFYVLEGAMTFQLEGEKRKAGPGEFVIIKRETLHAFVNAEGEAARCLILLRPAGLEGFFEDMAELLETNPGVPPDLQAILALGRKYNVDFDPPVSSR